MEGERLICSACDIERAVPVRKKRLRLKRVDTGQIKNLFDYRLDLPDDYSLERLNTLFKGIDKKGLEILHLEFDEVEEGAEQLKDLERRLEELPCGACTHSEACHSGKNREIKKILDELRKLSMQMEGTAGGLWLSFKRHLRFLKDTGFVDDRDQLTPDGYWASKLRLDHPLIIAEAIRNGAFNGVSPDVMTGCIAPFVWDRDQDLDVHVSGDLGLGSLEQGFSRVIENIADIRKRKVRQGFVNPQIFFWPAAALFLWAKGMPWEQLVSMIPADDGDLASLIVRTADHLRQVTNLRESHPDLAHTARTAIDLILREPVFIA
jgi:superfamily II RNA helicase